MTLHLFLCAVALPPFMGDSEVSAVSSWEPLVAPPKWPQTSQLAVAFPGLPPSQATKFLLENNGSDYGRGRQFDNTLKCEA